MSSSFRRPVYFNDPSARSWVAQSTIPAGEAAILEAFHRQFSDVPTRLVLLDNIAKELGVKAVYVKDESNRFGLRSFKILGASWGTFKALARELKLPLDTDIESIKKALASHPVTLYAASAGNHGWAVARMGAFFSIPAKILVPADMLQSKIDLIRREGAEVVVSAGTYDDAVSEVQEAAKESGGLLIQDFAFEGYEDVPQWIVDGYMTMMREVDRQLGDVQPDLVVTPTGVGSFAQAVVSHFKRDGGNTAVLAVEPDTAPCLWNSLQRGTCERVETRNTIMAGLACGTVSTIAWPLLQSGVDASVTISDYEAHVASLALKEAGVSSGPCGAAPLAAIRRLSNPHKALLGLTEDSVIVLLSTEGLADYPVPWSVSADDAVSLTQTLVQIDSSNPSMGTIPGPGEAEIARYIVAWLEHRAIEYHWIEPIKGRPSVVGIVRGSGGGKNLMFNGHIDTVTLIGYDDDPLSGKIEDGKLYGRGAEDMKCGVAAALVALANAKHQGLRGDVIFAGVADEEDKSLGTEQLLEAGWTADGAVVNEPTGLAIMHAHKGFAWFEVDIHGVAAHGSRPDEGVDAIVKAGHFLVELDRYSQQLSQRPCDPEIGPPSVHASIIKGGEEASSYAALCTVILERRTVAGETPASVEKELEHILQALSQKVPNFKYGLRGTFHRPAFELPTSHPFAEVVAEAVSDTLGVKTPFEKGPWWTDSALLAHAGIPSLIWGPRGAGLHGREEWVEIDSIQKVADGLSLLAKNFCQ